MKEELAMEFVRNLVTILIAIGLVLLSRAVLSLNKSVLKFREDFLKHCYEDRHKNSDDSEIHRPL